MLIRVTLKENDETKETEYVLKQLKIPRIMTKNDLIEFLFNTVFERNVIVDDDFVAQCVAHRKSKRHRKYVQLESPADFLELKRSLKVKNHISLMLRVYVSPSLKEEEEAKEEGEVKEEEKISDVKDSKSNESESKVPETNLDDFDDPPIEDPTPSGAFHAYEGSCPFLASPGELPFPDPLDPWKDTIHEFQNSGLWYGLRSFAASAAANHLEKRNLRVQNLADALNDNAAAISQILNGTASTLASAINQNATQLAEALNKAAPAQSGQTGSVPQTQPAPQTPASASVPPTYATESVSTPPCASFSSNSSCGAYARSVPPRVNSFAPYCMHSTAAASAASAATAATANATANAAAPSQLKVHTNVTCDTCYPTSEGPYITGVRYKCLTCSNFDMCSDCFNSEASLHSKDHVMIAINTPQAHIGANYRMRFPYGGQEEFQLFIRRYGSPETSEKLIKEVQLRGVGDFLELCKNLIDESYGIKKTETESIKESKEEEKDLEKGLESDSAVFVNSVEVAEVPDKDIVNEEGIATETAETTEIAFTEGASTEITEGSKAAKAVSSPSETASVETDKSSNSPDFSSTPIQFFLYPTGPMLAIMRITNKSNRTIQCEPLIIEITNFLGKDLAKVNMTWKHGIKPFRTATFNISLCNAHFKHPFRVKLSTGNGVGATVLKTSNFLGEVMLAPEATDAANTCGEAESIEVTESNEVAKEETEPIISESKSVPENDLLEQIKEKPKEEPKESSSSPKPELRHSLVFPKLSTSVQKLDKCSDDSLYFESRSSLSSLPVKNPFLNDAEVEAQLHDLALVDDEADTEEYDMVSASDADSNNSDVEDDDARDIGSDYEVLSPTISNEG